MNGARSSLLGASRRFVCLGLGVLFDRFFKRLHGQANAVLLLVRNLNKPSEDVSVLHLQSFVKSLSFHEIDEGHRRGNSARAAKNLVFRVCNATLIHLQEALHRIPTGTRQFCDMIWPSLGPGHFIKSGLFTSAPFLGGSSSTQV
jgi:hypothetical protein